MTPPQRSAMAAADVGWITADDMREVDRIMIHELHIELIQMMENAGRALATVTADRYSGLPIAVYVGSGGNGGGGLVAARHLSNRGHAVTIVLSRDAPELTPIPRHQLEICRNMGVPIAGAEPTDHVAVDALVGYSLSGPPHGATADLIRHINGHASAIVALDVPSGLDATTAEAHDPSVRADVTVTLAMPKTGLRDSELVGDLIVADISVPPALYDRLGVGPPPAFDTNGLVTID